MEIPAEASDVVETIEVAKTVVIRNYDDRLLILWRNETDEYNGGRPDFPGGQTEPGETRAQAAVRETEEEAGLRLAEGDLVHVCDVTTYEQRPWGVIRLSRSFFAAFVDEPEPTLGSEHHKLEWRSQVEAEELLSRSLPKLICLRGLGRISNSRRLAAAS